MASNPRWFATAALVLSLPLTLSADTLYLRNGTRVQGDLVAVRGNTIEFEERRGGFGGSRTIRVDRSEVDRIEFERRNRRPIGTAPWRRVDAQAFLSLGGKAYIPGKRATRLDPEGEPGRIYVVRIGVVIAQDLRGDRVAHAGDLRHISRVTIHPPTEERDARGRRRQP